MSTSIGLLILIEYMNVMDRQKDTLHHGIIRAMHSIVRQ